MARLDRDMPDYYPTTGTPVVDEQTKLAAQRADAARAAAAAAAATAENDYYTKKVGSTGKTQAQLDAAANALQTAYDINQMGPGFKSAVNPVTGMVETTTPTPQSTQNKPVAPGKAWVWNGSAWVKPAKPSDGKSYNWDDNNGWVLAGGGVNQPVAPGKAWVWDGTSWVKPAIPDDGKTYTWNDETGWVVSKINTSETTTAQVDSIAAITALLSSYGLGGLGPAITAAVMKGYSADTINLIMQDPNSNDPLAVAFQTRFPANKARLSAGKSVLSAAEYLAAERTYSQVFQSYGMASLGSRDTINSFLINDVSAAEVSDRISLAVNRVQNADADTKAALAIYYPMLNQADIVSAMLNPKDALPALQRKVQTAEIGGAARGQGLNLGMSAEQIAGYKTSAEQLASQGVTLAEARKGYATIADILPSAEKLSNIYGATQDVYGQTQGEQEVFSQLASAQRKRQRLSATETGTFGASAGMNRVSLTSGKAAGLI